MSEPRFRVRSLIRSNNGQNKNVVVLRPNYEFLMWKLPSKQEILETKISEVQLNGFKLFKMHYLKAFKGGVNLSKFDQAEISKTWEDADKEIHFEYEKLAFLLNPQSKIVPTLQLTSPKFESSVSPLSSVNKFVLLLEILERKPRNPINNFFIFRRKFYIIELQKQNNQISMSKSVSWNNLPSINKYKYRKFVEKVYETLDADTRKLKQAFGFYEIAAKKGHNEEKEFKPTLLRRIHLTYQNASQDCVNESSITQLPQQITITGSALIIIYRMSTPYKMKKF
ncbi:hypothetical protein RclHR1_00070029 [Rhizophagus clarus]|uniref:Uncharacterized protein n=1 Tax=Rhizophagus clarus TaxID=94130 RepID=A0A2Z6SBM0_9GLOM|nr:hypothetical protein RclHR1_00070029 [Rhizophagus clarus]GES78202.1 hypothetical protein GLOIN_2v1576747 [Rhizophagus clarus]